MSNYGFIQIPRSLRQDPLWIGFTCRERHAFEEFLNRMAFKETIQDDHGELIIIKPGQFMTTKRDFAEICNRTRPSDMAKFDKNFIERWWLKMERCHFSGHKVGHKKTIMTCLREDICDLIGPGIEPKVGQEWAKSGPQKNKENPENKDDMSNKIDLITPDCSHVHNPMNSHNENPKGCEHAKQSHSLLIDWEGFDQNKYRFPNGKPMSKQMKAALKKYSPEEYQLFLHNLLLCEERWVSGKIPDDGNYERYAFGAMKQNWAGKKTNREHNNLYIKALIEHYSLTEVKLNKSTVELPHEGSVSLDLPFEQIEHIMDKHMTLKKVYK